MKHKMRISGHGFLRFRKCCREIFQCCWGRMRRNARPASPSTSTLEDATNLSGRRKIKITIDIELHKVEQHDFPPKDSQGKEKVLFERRDLFQAAQSELACIRRDQEMSQYLRQVVSERRRETQQSALLQEHSFVNGLAALLEMYDLSKITPERDEPIEAMLMDLSSFYWTATLDAEEEDLSEVEKKLLDEAFGLTMRNLLRQSPTTEQFVFILKQLDPRGKLFLPAINQLLSCGNHHPRIDLQEVQQAFPDVPREIWQAGTTYENINEGDLEIEEL
ncbi:uncharacterized protein LOC132710561 isoform X1 [Pantherophis guttatus]|uniref:Uncharacterized protein LOC132710561 isoform X1 n=1 Tax=Pantherophis guttatus TaxID=94885 RepID=A0ABM3Z444_PANGU|nr:uncharacterized protein LOC132710561 isoform X1 [Pantherophis guttatus]